MESNPCIACSVDDCRHHCKSEDYCTLDKIKVDKSEDNTNKNEDTNCRSFEVK